MRTRAYCAHPSIRDHWVLRYMSRCPDQVVSLKQDLQCSKPPSKLVTHLLTHCSRDERLSSFCPARKKNPDLCSDSLERSLYDLDLSLVHAYFDLDLHYTRGWELGLVHVYYDLDALHTRLRVRPRSRILRFGLSLHARVGVRPRSRILRFGLALHARVGVRASFTYTTIWTRYTRGWELGLVHVYYDLDLHCTRG
ncbi:uncharacterized protein TNCV_4121961 [Trichonephila clavipes]|nr:uncharacterized protein TNCV_4121961 [Trichonephila clavipes]